ncbi:hypothetical protein C8Q75DRAFT_266277 [Abortiporus biennis]|nr:hypothetical protein C8Q75DRAFT_266277 [Abortiporus biennis]
MSDHVKHLDGGRCHLCDTDHLAHLAAIVMVVSFGLIIQRSLTPKNRQRHKSKKKKLTSPRLHIPDLNTAALLARFMSSPVSLTTNHLIHDPHTVVPGPLSSSLVCLPHPVLSLPVMQAVYPTQVHPSRQCPSDILTACRPRIMPFHLLPLELCCWKSPLPCSCHLVPMSVIPFLSFLFSFFLFPVSLIYTYSYKYL